MVSPARQADAGFISKYNKTKKCSESAGEKKYEFAITIPVVLPDKDYPPATSKHFRIEICLCSLTWEWETESDW